VKDTKHSLAHAVKEIVPLCLSFFTLLVVGCNSKHASPTNASLSPVSDLVSLVELHRSDLEKLEVARVNLHCAQGLPGAEHLDLTNSLTTIDRMATHVRSETERHLYHFRNKPSDFENSEGFFRMIMLMVVLTEDFQVHYASNKIASVVSAGANDGFFTDSRDVFLHGLTGKEPRGTCSSLPVLQVAVGRRLGYPLKLVTTKGHLFVRWEDSRERFNFEAAGQGANRFSDDYYRQWPFKVTQEEVTAEGYLNSLSRAEELAVFLSIRGMCWREGGRFSEAAWSFREANRLFPGCRSFQILQMQMEEKTRALERAGVASTKRKEQTP